MTFIDFDMVEQEIEDLRDSAIKALEALEDANASYPVDGLGLTFEAREEIIEGLDAARTALHGPVPPENIIQSIGQVESAVRRIEIEEDDKP